MPLVCRDHSFEYPARFVAAVLEALSLLLPTSASFYRNTSLSLLVGFGYLIESLVDVHLPNMAEPTPPLERRPSTGRERKPSMSAPLSDLQGPVGPGFSRPKHKRTVTGFGAADIKAVEASIPEPQRAAYVYVSRYHRKMLIPVSDGRTSYVKPIGSQLAWY
jgi:hypothetical protein